MRRQWADLLQQYVESGGTLIIENVPGWYTDLTGEPLNEWEKVTGDAAPGTVKFAELSGIRFRHSPRGAVTKIRMVGEHPLTEGMEEPGQWFDIPWPGGPTSYAYLAYPVTAGSAQVLIEAEQEACPYDGVAYVRRGTTNGVYPLLTINQIGRGMVIRHYADVSLTTALGPERFDRFCANLVKFVRTRYNSSRTD